MKASLLTVDQLMEVLDLALSKVAPAQRPLALAVGLISEYLDDETQTKADVVLHLYLQARLQSWGRGT